MKQKVLFVCIHNSARSQMAEELLRQMAGDRFEAESAGLEPGTLNPLAVEALKEKGIDISGKKTQDVFDLYKKGRRYDYVVTVCDEANAERCPMFPSTLHRLHWGFPDPSALAGTREERLGQTRAVRDQIETRIKQWLESISHASA